MASAGASVCAEPVIAVSRNSLRRCSRISSWVSWFGLGTQAGCREVRGDDLPASDDALLGPVLAALQADPGDRRSLAEWARVIGTTERTLSRRCRHALGMSFNDWRQRLKLLTALSLLEAGHPIQSIAYRLGYSTASAFIAMFRQLTGMSPTALRRRGSAS